MRASLDDLRDYVLLARLRRFRLGYLVTSPWSAEFTKAAFKRGYLGDQDVVVNDLYSLEIPVPHYALPQTVVWTRLVDMLLVPTQWAGTEVDAIVSGLRGLGIDTPVNELRSPSVVTGPQQLVYRYRSLDFVLGPESVVSGHYANGAYLDYLQRMIPRRFAGPVRLLDMCSGQGSVGLCCYFENAQVASVALAEINPRQVATLNKTLRLQRLNPQEASVHLSDVFSGIPVGLVFDLMVGNPPHQDRAAVTMIDRQGGDPAWGFHRRFFAEAARYLAPGGLICLIENGGPGMSTPNLFEDMVRQCTDDLVLDEIVVLHGTEWYLLILRRQI